MSPEYYQEHREYLLQKQKLYRINNLAKIKKYEADNREQILERKREYYQLNKEEIKIKSKNWNWEDSQRWLLVCSKSRAKKLGLEHTLNKEDIIIPEFCPILGIPLFKGTDGKRCDNSPSIDRVDNSKGYTKDNIMVISWRANKLKSDGRLEELELIVQYMRDNL